MLRVSLFMQGQATTPQTDQFADTYLVFAYARHCIRLFGYKCLKLYKFHFKLALKLNKKFKL